MLPKPTAEPIVTSTKAQRLLQVERDADGWLTSRRRRREDRASIPKTTLDAEDAGKALEGLG